MPGWFDWAGFGSGLEAAGADAMLAGADAASAPAAASGGLFTWGQGGGGLNGGGLFGSGLGGGASFSNPGLPNMGLLRFGAALMSPDPNAWSRAATALQQGAAFDQKLRKELAAREASANAPGASDSGVPGTSPLGRSLDPALTLRMAALAETQRDRAAAAPAAPSMPASSLRLPRAAPLGAGAGAAPAAGAVRARAPSAVSQRPAPALRIRLDAQGRRIG